MYFKISAQVIEGMIFNELNKDPLPFANIIIEHTDNGTTTDSAGRFKLNDIKPGLYNLIVSYTGFQKHIIHQLEIQSNRSYYYDIGLKQKTEHLKAVKVSTPAFKKTAATPLSITSFNESEIRKFPGAVMDITKIIKTCPGVAPKTTFGYNIIFRGGASHENRFFLDGIEILIVLLNLRVTLLNITFAVFLLKHQRFECIFAFGKFILKSLSMDIEFGFLLRDFDLALLTCVDLFIQFL